MKLLQMLLNVWSHNHYLVHDAKMCLTDSFVGNISELFMSFGSFLRESTRVLLNCNTYWFSIFDVIYTALDSFLNCVSL
jgi:hypothetical protein